MIIKYLFTLFIFATLTYHTAMAQSADTRIRHTVIFKLKHPKGSAEETNFLNAARKLTSIHGVEKFECLRQISTKNKFDYGLSMEFANQQVYISSITTIPITFDL